MEELDDFYRIWSSESFDVLTRFKAAIQKLQTHGPEEFSKLTQNQDSEYLQLCRDVNLIIQDYLQHIGQCDTPMAILGLSDELNFVSKMIAVYRKIVHEQMAPRCNEVI